MSGLEWLPIESAPKDRHVLLCGTQEPFNGLDMTGVLVFSGYWDACDQAWCSTGSLWNGPFYTPTHWMPLPEPPAPPHPSAGAAS